jgi:REP element-mobilizing transposase RayT
MPKGLKRFYGRGDLHFLTFSCYQRLPLLGTTRARHLFVQALGKIRERYKFLLVGYVVMPNYVHLLISEPPNATPSQVLKVLRQRVSRDLRKKRRRVPAGQLCLSERWRKSAAFLAAEILRLQRLEQEESARKAGVHARQPGHKETRSSPEGLAVE